MEKKLKEQAEEMPKEGVEKIVLMTLNGCDNVIISATLDEMKRELEVILNSEEHTDDYKTQYKLFIDVALRHLTEKLPHYIVPASSCISRLGEFGRNGTLKYSVPGPKTNKKPFQFPASRAVITDTCEKEWEEICGGKTWGEC